jgi:RHS repeat-associated protein
MKQIAFPETLPYDISLSTFAIATGDVGIDADDVDPGNEGNDVLSDASSGLAETGLDKLGLSVPAAESPAVETGETSLMTLSDPREGCFYIYSFDGRLLAEYDIYGESLKDYIYMGARLVAEFKPSTAQYFYYTQDQIGSTRVVTNDTGAVVYAEAHDPYGGIQKTWVNNFEPKRKFSDKERDEETGLDYFGARYYANKRYRWISVDSVLPTERAIACSQTWNLYSFCENNPATPNDPDGRVVRCTSLAAFVALKNTIVDPILASKITWDKLTGIVSVEDFKSDDPNFISLKALVSSSQEVVVSAVDSVPYLDASRDYAEVWAHVGHGSPGFTIFPRNGRPSPMVRDSDSLLVVVARKYYRDKESEQARTLAHELYGHAYLYISGLPFLHDLTPDKRWDPNGFVNRYTDQITQRRY